VPITNSISSDFERQSVYVYDQWEVWSALLLSAGVSYDRLTFPGNFRYAPLSEGEETREQFSPKVGLTWTPTRRTTVRAAWYRALSGMSLDQSVRLEPSQVAGFNQAWRSVIPESVGGASAAATFETWAVSLEQKVGRKTFVALSGEILSSEVERSIGVVDFSVFTGFIGANTREQLDFRERTVALTVNQLLGDEWSVGARYRLSQAELDDVFPDIPAGVSTQGGFQREQDLEATLHQLYLFTVFNHPSGFFAGGNAMDITKQQGLYTGPSRR